MTYTLRSFSSLAEVGSRPSGGPEHEVGLAPIRSPLFPTAPHWLWANAWVCECRLVTRTPFSTFHELSTWHSTSFCAGIECFSVLLLLLFLYKFFTTSILSFRNIFFFLKEAFELEYLTIVHSLESYTPTKKTPNIYMVVN